MPNQVFVYGTLKRGFSRYRTPALRDLRAGTEENACVVGTLYDLGLYPGLRIHGSGLVHGEIQRFRPIESALCMLDAIEGYRGPRAPGNLFVRQRILATDAWGRNRDCWVYLYAQEVEDFRGIASGLWTKGGFSY
ncbi:MAG: gamma-glutamylcyclotransferase family protein [Pseudomonadota bacterium]